MNKIRKADKRLSSLISRIGHNEAGFSMISAIMALMVGTLLSLAAWATANSDIAFTDKDKWTRLAYQRAQSGVSDYVQHMAEDSGYWKACDRPDGVTNNGIGQTALNDNDFGATGHAQRRWLPMSATAGSTDDLSYHAQYSIDLQPTTGTCKPSATAADRMIDNQSGTFKIAVTGRAGPLVPPNLTGSAIETWRQNNWKRVTIIAEFRRNGFLDYGYFTDHEGRDPKLQSASLQTACNAYYQDNPGYDSSQPRSETNVPGRWRQNATSSDCTEIQFADGDKLAGPFHTNDSVLLGSSPTSGSSALFGNANKGDRVEIYNNGKSNCGVRTQDVSLPNNSSSPSGCYNTVRGNTGVTVVPPGPAARYLDLPEDNDDLVLYADPNSGDPDSQGYTFQGKTTIRINTDNTIDVANAIATGSLTTFENRPFPTSGVIYVQNYNVSACGSSPYSSIYASSIPAGCALVEVSGTYNKSLTIGSESDIVVTGDIKRGTSQTAVLGLIANQYVRIRHYPKSGSDRNYANSSGSCARDGSGTNLPGGGTTTTAVNNVQAAILTLNNSFTVDGYQCGGSLGNLNFTGALAQRWRGTVGTGGCGSGTGYCKNYAYDYTFKSQTPPHFLAPSAATWKIIRMRQVLPACACKSTG